jgi:hypothetical protein
MGRKEHQTMGNFQPLSKSRAEEIHQAIAESRTTGQGLAISPETGECLGVAPVNVSPDDQRNVIGRFTTHFGT